MQALAPSEACSVPLRSGRKGGNCARLKLNGRYASKKRVFTPEHSLRHEVLTQPTKGRCISYTETKQGRYTFTACVLSRESAEAADGCRRPCALSSAPPLRDSAVESEALSTTSLEALDASGFTTLSAPVQRPRQHVGPPPSPSRPQTARLGNVGSVRPRQRPQPLGCDPSRL